MAQCVSLAHVNERARALSRQLIDNRSVSKYNVHGLSGIFGNGDLIAGTRRRYKKNYEDVKVDFMRRHACAIGSRQQELTVCEVGFNAGLSALLLLEAMPRARVLSFDLGDFPWARAADALLRSQYGPARFPGVVFGDAVRQIPAYALARGLACDAAFVDGDKAYRGRYGTLAELRRVSRGGAAVFMDEVTTEACVNGTYPPGAEHARRCAALNAEFWPSVRAYAQACREGWLAVEQCAWPTRHPYDGICLGRFLKTT